MCVLLLASSDKSNFIFCHLSLPSHPVPVIIPPTHFTPTGLPSRSQTPICQQRSRGQQKTRPITARKNGKRADESVCSHCYLNNNMSELLYGETWFTGNGEALEWHRAKAVQPGVTEDAAVLMCCSSRWCSTVQDNQMGNPSLLGRQTSSTHEHKRDFTQNVLTVDIRALAGWFDTLPLI